MSVGQIAAGEVSLFNANGSAHVIVDVVGWYSSSADTTGARLRPAPPARILDTRNGTGGFASRVGPGQRIDVPVAGRGGVPSSGASAVVMNVTVTEPTAPSHLIMFPSGTTRPLASNLNYVPGQTVPNLVVAKLGPDGKVSVYNNSGSAHLILDVSGWFTS